MISIRDRDELRRLIEQLRQDRNGIAYLIRSSMTTLSDIADDADKSPEGYQLAKETLVNKSSSLDEIRLELHESEKTFVDALSTTKPVSSDEGRTQKKSIFKRLFHMK